MRSDSQRELSLLQMVKRRVNLDTGKEKTLSPSEEKKERKNQGVFGNCVRIKNRFSFFFFHFRTARKSIEKRKLRPRKWPKQTA